MGTAGQSVTLANSIIGVGILAMPFCFQQCGAALAVLMLLLSSMVSRLACYFLLKSAIIARRRNFEFLAFHVFGATGKLAVEIGIIGFLMGTCIAYFVVVGDLGPQIISKMFNINQSDVLRTCVMVLVSLVCVLPLGLLRNVDSLSNVSAATIGFYFCLIFKVIAEAASQLFTGNWWSKIELWKPEGVLQCVPIFSMALFCQTQLFEIFETLPSLSLEKMNLVTKNALNICTSVYLMVGTFGYIAFCAQPISGNILVSLSPTMASDVIKLGFVMSLAFSFPLIIFPCRASLYSLLYRKECDNDLMIMKVLPSHHDHIINHSIPEGTFKCITVGIIAISLLVSLMIPNIELVLGLVGSTIGVVVCVLFPAACFVNLTIKNTNERLLAKIILCLGFIVMILGTYANLQAAESKLDHHDITQDKIDKIVHDFLETNKQKFNSEDAIIKPELKIPESVKEHHKNQAEVVADKNSEVQPPNPVAPDPHSDESKKVDTPPKPPPILKPVNKGKLEQNEIEGAGDKEASINTIDNNKTESEEKKIKAIKEAVKEKEIQHIVANSALNQDNLKILKEQALIETIKQHGEEQKELIKEQKSILDELRKTKLEIEMKKKESLDKEQANKIAVESIQKIANIAIKSLSGVTDKPNETKPEISAVDSGRKLSDPSHLLQEAVQSIESIVNKAKPKTTVAPGSNNQPLAHVDSENETKNKVELKSEVTGDSGGKVQLNNPDPVVVISDKNHIHTADEPKSYVQGEDMEKLKQSENKLSPSEIDALIKNVPVPMVMNPSQAKIPNVSDNHKPVMTPQLQKIPAQNNAVVPQIIEKGNENVHSRVKRNVVDCSKQNLISDEDRKRCRDLNKTSIIDSGIDIKISQKLTAPEEIDLGKVKLLDERKPNVNVRHYSRVLQSVNESEPS